MVRLADLSEAMRSTVTSVACPSFDTQPWVAPLDPASRRVAIVSSAGLHARGAAPFQGGEGGYRAIADALPAADILMSHVSVNFDRSGYQRDLELVLPRRRLHELAADGAIGAVADTHYSFMGATDPAAMREDAVELAGRLRASGVDTALLLPV